VREQGLFAPHNNQWDVEDVNLAHPPPRSARALQRGTLCMELLWPLDRALCNKLGEPLRDTGALYYSHSLTYCLVIDNLNIIFVRLYLLYCYYGKLVP